MIGIPKILKVLFVILILIVLGELGYYLYYQVSNNNRAATPNENPPLSINIAELIPTQPASIVTNPALNQTLIYGLARLRKGIVTHATTNLTLAGILTEVDVKGGVIPSVNIQYQIRLVLQKDNEKNTVYFTKKNLENTKLVERANGVESPYEMNKLQINDNIQIELVLDLTKDILSNIINAKIAKITK